MSLVVGYRAGPERSAGSGLQVHDDGTIELSQAAGAWQRIGALTEAETEELAGHVRAAGIPELPPEVPRPESMRGGSDAEWWTELDGRPVRAVIRGWSDGNPAAAPSRALVMEISRLVTAAQTRE